MSNHLQGSIDKQEAERTRRPPGLYVSLAGHAALAAGILLGSRFGLFTGVDIIAAGPGQGRGVEGGSAMQVGVASPAELFSVAPWADTASLGQEPRSRLNNLEMSRTRPDRSPEEAIRIEDRPESKRSPDNRVVTDRPLIESPARPYAAKTESAPRTGTSAVVGPSPGSAFPAVTGAPGVGMGSGGVGGVPGGSEYGRRLQQALSGYYRYSPPANAGTRFVVVQIKIDRTGRVLSIVNGRLEDAALLQSSRNVVIDSRVIAALLELDRNPIPFPPGFLGGLREANAEIYFQY